MKRKHIGNSLLASVLLFAFLLVICVGAVGYKHYKTGMINKVSLYAESIIDYVINGIDGDKFKEAVESSERTDEIVRVEAVCDNMKNTHEIAYIYIVKPLNLETSDNMKYILTGEPVEDREKDYLVPNGSLSGEEYAPEVVEWYFKSMDNPNEQIFFTNETTFGYMYTGMKTITDSDNNSVAVVAVDIMMDDIKSNLYTYLLIVVLSAIGITVFFIIIIYFWLYKRIVKPIDNIEKATNKFVELSHKGVAIEDLVYDKPNIKIKDEIESLSNSIDTMSNDLKNYMLSVVKAEGEKNRIAGELNVATHIQSSMLPCIFPAFPNDDRFEIYATMDPAKEVGGDFYDFFMIDNKHIAIVVADVSGKGVPAALFMVIGKTLIKDHTTIDRDLGDVFNEVNNLLCESNSEGLFITAFEAVINLETGHVVYVDAGHEMPYVYKKGKSWTAYKKKQGFVLAGMEEMKYSAGEFTLEHGDRIFQYTDGVTEATNIENKLYGMDRLKNALDANIDKNSEELLKAVKNDIDRFVGEAPQFDDITMLGFFYK